VTCDLVLLVDRRTIVLYQGDYSAFVGINTKQPAVHRNQQYSKTPRLLESSNAEPDDLDAFPAPLLAAHEHGQNDLDIVRVKETIFHFGLAVLQKKIRQEHLSSHCSDLQKREQFR
jgi:hypothetical protein